MGVTSCPLIRKDNMNIKDTDYFQIVDGSTNHAKNITIAELKEFFKPVKKPAKKKVAKEATEKK